jgi:hypothetical protein
MLGAFRTGQDRPPDPGADLQRLVLYLTAAELEEAQEQAIRSGHGTPQRLCEALVRRELEAGRVNHKVELAERRHGRLAGLHAIASDPDYLAEITGAGRARGEPEGRPAAGGGSRAVLEPSAESVVRRHAGLEGPDDGHALLPALRRGASITPEAAAALLEALRRLEEALADRPLIDRALGYALHKLAFEGQVLASDSWTGAALDAATVALLRRVQEGVDRVLSGQDIRYDAPQGRAGVAADGE